MHSMTQHIAHGVATGSGDRALEGKARVPGTMHTHAPTPRVISFQNRMHLTQSPGRAAPICRWVVPISKENIP